MNLRYIYIQPDYYTLSPMIGEVYCARLKANINFINNYLSKEVRKLKLDCGHLSIVFGFRSKGIRIIEMKNHVKLFVNR